MKNAHQTKVVALLSGGLDSILAAKLMESQGVAVTCLHFYTPFFGSLEKVPHWEKVHGLTILSVNIGEEYAAMLAQRPVHGFGKVLNPCVDCKILMLRRAKIIMEELGACAIVTGEVLGQRPMSQRRDTLNVIQRDAGVKGLLLRPLTALHLDPCKAELEGKIDRSRLLGISGRGRKDQLALARTFGLKEIPTPAGGCRLAEKENARNYWNVLRFFQQPGENDFALANTGRQFWSETGDWLIIGRNQADNDALMALAAPEDMVMKVRDFAGPVALLRMNRKTGETCGMAAPKKAFEDGALPGLAAALTASYSPKAVAHAQATGETIAVRLHPGSLDNPGEELFILPVRESDSWKESEWEASREGIRAERKEHEGKASALAPFYGIAQDTRCYTIKSARDGADSVLGECVKQGGK